VPALRGNTCKSPSFRLNGVAQESNPPGRGLHDHTGFEGLMQTAARLD
jgi:hypothetical protein